MKPLAEWWEETAAADLAAVAPQTSEYGAVDLLLVGRTTSMWLPNPTTDTAAQEIACVWYLMGKVGRAVSAYAGGGSPSDDTLLDMTVYSMMARRVRQSGGWPQ